MQKVVLLFAIVLCSFAASTNAQTNEKEAVRTPLENYIKAHATGDPEYARKAFHAEGT